MFYYLSGGSIFLCAGILWSILLLLDYHSFILMYDFGSILSLDNLELVFLVDFLSCSFLMILSFMVSSVYFFSIIYLSKKICNFRFFSLLLLFVVSMYILILSPNLISFIMGWDGLGFTSFLLVGWFGCFSSWSASMKTFLMNRFGDGLFLVSIVLLFNQGHFNVFSFDLNLSCFLLFMLLLALSTKSAQYPFSSWLPAAMSAPTPVSALVHSSTLVTAGLYFLIRFNYMFTQEISFVICLFGLITMLVGSFCAILEMDLKKIVAYSTLSQLGFMGFTVGVGFSDLAFFYLLVHASFKALMFISVGLYMVNGGHFQDLRSLNKVWHFSPLIFISLFLSVAAISGIPFLSAFFMKDLMILNFSMLVVKGVMMIMFFLSLIFTSFYSFRLLSAVSFSSLNFLVAGNSHSIPLLVLFPLYFSSSMLGCMFEKFLLVSYKMPSLFLVFLFFLAVSGSLLGIYSYFFEYLKFISVYSSFSLLFFCQYMKISFKSIFLSGSNFFCLLDKGMFSLKFIDKLNNLFMFNFNAMYKIFYSLGWLSLVLMSFVFIFSLFIL